MDRSIPVWNLFPKWNYNFVLGILLTLHRIVQSTQNPRQIRLEIANLVALPCESRLAVVYGAVGCDLRRPMRLGCRERILLLVIEKPCMPQDPQGGNDGDGEKDPDHPGNLTSRQDPE